MPNHQLLDNVTHKDLKIITEHRPGLGDDASYTNIFPFEYADAQVHYPIFFMKNNLSNKFESIALFGFEQGENLYLSEAGWNANYIPLTIARRPFLIGFNTKNENGAITEEAVVHVDMDSPRVSETEGESVFLPQGGQSEYLEQIASTLNAIHQGHQQNDEFIHALVELDLLESVNIEVELKDGSKHQLGNLYTINENTLDNLSDANLYALHQKSYLKMIYMVIASLGNITKLIDAKNARLTQG
ncbi:SapC family protein [Catenovulum maritimum]|uniref:SapC family protein n=1 Tax=Catenovulum maritimum TaxID=1513271 RepID=A0A0J8GT21_9ALTE|nr:SapC family protein [Catenovulum maritimum]KMT64439.1 SapC family protein [Catenovulum maritimum]